MNSTTALYILVGLCIATHIWMMVRGHKHHAESTSDKKSSENPHSGCH